ncbi:hypothetical protein BGZ94_005503 [Podila epigama]|nr:hypothetical protein BGZ94_005503 [Podila epigama]
MSAGRRQFEQQVSYQNQQYQHQPAFNNVFSFTTTAPTAYRSNPLFPYLEDDVTDEEEQLLLAALERKKQERLARQEYLQKLQQEQQALLRQRQYQALLRKEQQRQVIAQARYKAEQEAIRTELKAYQQRQAALARAQAISRSKDAARKDVSQQQQLLWQVIAVADERAQAAEQDEDEDTDEENTLDELFQHLFTHFSKRPLVQESGYPCKRHQRSAQWEEQTSSHKLGDGDKELSVAENGTIVEPEADAQSKDVPASNRSQSEQGHRHPDFIDVFTLLESVFGLPRQSTANSSSSTTSGSNSQSSQAGIATATTTNDSATPSAAAAARNGSKLSAVSTSSSDASPELRACDILRQRQQREQQRQHALQQKHSELNLIESTLDELARELEHSLVVYEGTAEVKHQAVIATEENVTKAMYRIDSVESEGDLSVRQRRKELIKKSQDLLEMVDDFKKKESNASKQVASKDVETESVVGDSESSAESSEQEVDRAEGEAQAEAAIGSEDNDNDLVMSLDKSDEDSDLRPQSESDEDDIQPYTVTSVEVTTQREEQSSEKQYNQQSEQETEGKAVESGAASSDSTTVDSEDDMIVV